MVNAQVVSAISDAEKEQIKQIIRDKFGVHASAALAIAECESGYNPNSINFNDAKITGYNSWGVFMHNEPQFEGWNDPVISTNKAWEKFLRRGWQPWKNCARKNKLMI